MIVDMPFAYTAKVVPPGKRNARETVVIDRLPLRIPTAEPAALPVAFRFSPGRDIPWDLEADARAAFHAARAMEIRWDGADLWAPYGHSFDRADAGAERERISEAEAGTRVAAMSGTPFSSAQWGDLIGHQRRAAVPADRLEGRVVADDRRDRVADLLGLARCVRFLDGQFWEPATEPCWEGEGDRFPYARAALSTPFRLQAPATVWRADRLGDALADLEETRGRGDHAPKAQGAIEILIPEAVRLPLDEIQLVSCSRALVNHLREALPGASVGFFAAYAELRDSSAACAGDAVSERLAGAVAALLSHPEARCAETGRHRWLLDHLARAERRWMRSLQPPAPDANWMGDAQPRIPGR